jgi:hypothetical protein
MMAALEADNEHIADARAMAKLAYIYHSSESRIRHELEVVRNLKKPKKPKAKPKFKRTSSLV